MTPPRAQFGSIILGVCLFVAVGVVPLVWAASSFSASDDVVGSAMPDAVQGLVRPLGVVGVVLLVVGVACMVFMGLARGRARVRVDA